MVSNSNQEDTDNDYSGDNCDDDDDQDGKYDDDVRTSFLNYKIGCHIYATYQYDSL